MVLENPIKDLKFLLDRGYKRKSALNLVSTRYSLDKKQKNFLLRKVFSEKEIKEHKRKLIPVKKIKGEKIIIDTYNVLITVETILSKKGERELVEGMDGFLRDFRGIFSSYKFDENTKIALEKIFKVLKKFEPEFSLFILDSQISRSGELASYIRQKLSEYNLKGNAQTKRSADSFICKKNLITLTSDTKIIEKVDRVVDIGAEINRK
jgi:hypothetical protein